MSFSIFLIVSLGMGIGYFLFPGATFTNLDFVIDLGLMLLLFFVGIDMGREKGIFKSIRKLGLKILLIPIAVIIGSIIGGMVAGLFIDLPYNEAGAVASGLGWYTLSSMMLSSYSPELSTLAFLSNVTRELLALLLIPLVAKYIGKYETIAPSGATAMDTCLPMISKSTDGEIAIIAFVSGVICTAIVPIILPIILNL